MEAKTSTAIRQSTQFKNPLTVGCVSSAHAPYILQMKFRKFTVYFYDFILYSYIREFERALLLNPRSIFLPASILQMIFLSTVSTDLKYKL
jgi:hypothetical protein